MKAVLISTIACIVLLLGPGAAAGQQPTEPSSPQPITSPADTQTAIADVPVQISDAEDERYRIGFQDTIEIQIFRHPELTQRVSVNSNGTINLFGVPTPVVAVCKTERELATDVAEAYKKDYLRNPQVNVVAVEQKSQAFSVIGAVEKPGHYFINRRVRLLELLAYAGGPSKEAGSRMFVARTGSSSNCQAAVADLDDFELMDFKIDDVMRAKVNLVMQPGDVVSVADADVIYVYGSVNKQGQIQLKEPITLTQAIATAEGLESAAKKGKIRVLRQKPGSLEREEFIYNIKDIEARKVQDPYLEPNDVVAVSEDRTKAILNSIGKSLTSGASMIFYRVP